MKYVFITTFTRNTVSSETYKTGCRKKFSELNSLKLFCEERTEYTNTKIILEIFSPLANEVSGR